MVFKCIYICALRRNIMCSRCLNSNEKLFHSKVTPFKKKIILHLNSTVVNIHNCGKYRSIFLFSLEKMKLWWYGMGAKVQKGLVGKEPQLWGPLWVMCCLILANNHQTLVSFNSQNHFPCLIVQHFQKAWYIFCWNVKWDVRFHCCLSIANAVFVFCIFVSSAFNRHFNSRAVDFILIQYILKISSKVKSLIEMGEKIALWI